MKLYIHFTVVENIFVDLKFCMTSAEIKCGSKQRQFKQLCLVNTNF